MPLYRQYDHDYGNDFSTKNGSAYDRASYYGSLGNSNTLTRGTAAADFATMLKNRPFKPHALPPDKDPTEDKDPQSYGTPDYRSLLANYFREQNEKARQASLEAILQRLNTGLGEYETELGNIDKTYQGLINQSEKNRFKSKASIREALSNRGQLDSGLGRQEQLYMDTTYNNNVSNLKSERENQKQNVRNLIAELKAQYAQDKANINNEYNQAILNWVNR